MSNTPQTYKAPSREGACGRTMNRRTKRDGAHLRAISAMQLRWIRLPRSRLASVLAARLAPVRLFRPVGRWRHFLRIDEVVLAAEDVRGNADDQSAHHPSHGPIEVGQAVRVVNVTHSNEPADHAASDGEACEKGRQTVSEPRLHILRHS